MLIFILVSSFFEELFCDELLNVETRSVLHLYIQACIYPFFIFERHHTQSILATGQNICSRSFVTRILSSYSLSNLPGFERRDRSLCHPGDRLVGCFG